MRMRSWLVVLLVAVSLGGSASGAVSRGASSAGGGSGASGTWSVDDHYPKPIGLVHDSYTFVRKGISNLYDITSTAAPFQAVASVPSTGGSATLDFCPVGDPKGTHFLEQLTFKFSRSGKATFSGTFREIVATTGAIAWSGTLKGVRSGPPRKKVDISGGVYQRKCARGLNRCVLIVAAVEGRDVVLSGNGKTMSTETDAHGRYSFTVKKGRYTVSVPAAPGTVKPASTVVNAQTPVAGVDFDICKKPKGYTGRKVACDLAEVDVTVLDGAGAPHQAAIASVPGDSGLTDQGGLVVLQTAPGRVTVTANAAYLAKPPTDTATVNAVAGRVSTVTLRLGSGIEVTEGLTAPTLRVVAVAQSIPRSEEHTSE